MVRGVEERVIRVFTVKHESVLSGRFLANLSIGNHEGRGRIQPDSKVFKPKV